MDIPKEQQHQIPLESKQKHSLKNLQKKINIASINVQQPKNSALQNIAQKSKESGKQLQQPPQKQPLSSNEQNLANQLQCLTFEEEKKDQQDKQQQQQQDIFSNLKFVKNIGFGSSGYVDQAINIKTNQYVALKCIPLNTDEVNRKQLAIELETLQKNTCPYIIKCQGYKIESGNITAALEFMDMGSLADLVKLCGRISENLLGLITLQVLRGLDYLHHKMHLIHRDIKPQNILLNSEGEAKIADFGVSGKIVHTNDNKSSWVGTIVYMSPERLKGDHYSCNTDIWSLGLTMLECAIGHLPFFENGKTVGFWDLLDYIGNRDLPIFGEDFSDQLKNFLEICLQNKPENRKSTTELLQHPFIKKFENISFDSLKNFLIKLKNSTNVD